MLKVIHTKLLVAILAAIAAIGAWLYHVHEAHVRAAEEARKHDAETWKFVQQQRQKNNSNSTNGSKTWTHYLP